MPRNEVGQLGRVLRLGNRAKRLFGSIFLDLGVAFKLFGDRAQQRFYGGTVTCNFVQRFGTCLKIALVGHEIGDPHAALALDQNLDGAIGKFQQLQHVGQHARTVDAVGIGVVNAGVNLAGKQDLAVVGHHRFERAHGFFAADKQRHDHVRKHHDVA